MRITTKTENLNLRQHLRHANLSGFRDKPHELHLSDYFNDHEHKNIPIHSWNCELWVPEKNA